MNWFQIKGYLTYFLLARHRKGYGIHSPFVFELVREIIYQKQGYYLFGDVEVVRRMYKKDNAIIRTIDFGARANDQPMERDSRISDLVRRAAVRPKYGELLSRLVTRFAPQNIVELGTSLGVGTLCLALPNRKANVWTIEGCPQTLEKARQTFRRFNLSGIRCVNGHFDKALSEVLDECGRVDFAFVDGNHRGEATLRYFEQLLAKSHNSTVLVFDDIHWSSDMQKAWEKIVAHSKVTVSIDLYQFGIVFFRRECQKQHFVVRY